MSENTAEIARDIVVALAQRMALPGTIDHDAQVKAAETVGDMYVAIHKKVKETTKSQPMPPVKTLG